MVGGTIILRLGLMAISYVWFLKLAILASESEHLAHVGPSSEFV